MDLMAFHLKISQEEDKPEFCRMYGVTVVELDELLVDFQNGLAWEESNNETKLLNARGNMIGYLALGGALSRAQNDARYLELHEDCQKMLAELNLSKDKGQTRAAINADLVVAEKLAEIATEWGFAWIATGHEIMLHKL